MMWYDGHKHITKCRLHSSTKQLCVLILWRGGGTKFQELLKHLGMPAEPLLKRSAVHHIPISTIKYLSAEILEPLCGAV